MSRDIPPQEQHRKWFRSHLLNRELELQELYDLPQGELDLVMAETAEIRSDPENRSRSHGRWCTAGYVLELAKIIDCLLYTSPSPRDRTRSRMPSSA